MSKIGRSNRAKFKDFGDLAKHLDRQKVKRRLEGAFNGNGAAKVRIEDDCVPPETKRKGKKP